MTVNEMKEKLDKLPGEAKLKIFDIQGDLSDVKYVNLTQGENEQFVLISNFS